jgi:hypothetical protein
MGSRIRFTVAVLITAIILSSSPVAEAKSGVGPAIIGGLIGLGVGIAIAGSNPPPPGYGAPPGAYYPPPPGYYAPPPGYYPPPPPAVYYGR